MKTLPPAGAIPPDDDPASPGPIQETPILSLTPCFSWVCGDKRCPLTGSTVSRLAPALSSVLGSGPASSPIKPYRPRLRNYQQLNHQPSTTLMASTRKCPAGSWNWRWFSCRPPNRMGGCKNKQPTRRTNDEKIQKTDRTSQTKSREQDPAGPGSPTAHE